MIRSALQIISYFYLVYSAFYYEPSAALIFYSMWAELLLMVLVFIILKIFLSGFDYENLEYLGGIIVGMIPILLVLSIGIFMYSNNMIQQMPKTQLYAMIKMASVGVIINYIITLFYFLKNRGTESDFISNIIFKLISLFVIFIISFFILNNISNPNLLAVICIMVLIRYLLELGLNKNFMKAIKT
jgi:hypothetical protein